MSYSAPNRLLMPARHSIDTIGDSWLMSLASASGSSAWPSANLAIYVPLRIPSRVVVRRLWYSSGSTATGNTDMGLYSASGAAVISATETAKAGIGERYFDVTDTPVGPGLYYIALSASNNTDTYGCYSPSAPLPCAQGVLIETSAYPLPSTATWALDQTLAYVPIIGLTLETTS